MSVLDENIIDSHRQGTVLRVKGAYRMADGTQALDDSAAYSVVLDESQVEDLAELLRQFKNKTLQEAIYLEIQWDVEVRFV